MSTTTSTLSYAAQTRPSSPWLPILTGWHVVLGLIALFGAILTVSRAQLFAQDISGVDPIFRALIGAAQAAIGILSLVTVAGLLNRRGFGRMLSLLLNYVGLVLAIIVVLQGLDVFIGIDSLADHLTGALPALIGTGVLLFLYTQLSRLPEGDFQGLARRVLLVLIGIATVILLVQLGLIEGLAGAASRLGAVLPALVITAVFAVMTWGIFDSRTAAQFKETMSSREAIAGWLFLSPNLLGFLIFFAGPLIVSLFLSFTQYELFTPPTWRGTQNYSEILGLSVGTLSDPTTAASTDIAPGYQEIARLSLPGRTTIIGASDPLFWTALRNTVTWVLMLVPLSILPALGLAVLVNSKLPGMKLFRPLFFLPVVAGVVGVALIWYWLYSPQIGVFNSLIHSVVDTVNTIAGRAVLTDPKIQWLQHADSAQFSIVVMAAWMAIGYNMIIFLAGLQNIPRPLYEAAYVDGATGWKSFWYITLPMLAPTTFFVTTTTLITSFQVFSEPYVMGSNNGAGPSNSTLTSVVYLYKTGFASSNHMGYASAIAWILVVIIFFLTLAQFRLSERFTNIN